MQRTPCPTNECENLRRGGEVYCSSCKGKVSSWTCPVCARGHHFPTSARRRHCFDCGNTFWRD